MKCPECGAELVEKREVSIDRLKTGESVALEYTKLTCTNCGAQYIGAKSLDEAWNKISGRDSMKFQVFRTSELFFHGLGTKRKKPCEEAKYEEVECQSIINDDKRLISYYIVEINSLEDLLNLIKKHGKVILNESNDREYFKDFSKPVPLYEIEIYDDYRE